MTVSIKVHSARTTNKSRDGAIKEISYTIFDTDAGPIGKRTAITLPLDDVDGDGFIDLPKKDDLAGFVLSTLESLPGAQGFRTALETLCYQLKTEINAPKEQPEELSDFRPDDGFDEDDDEDEQ